MHLRQAPLRILMIINLPWDARLGAARVWIELAEQWRAMGHAVEKFSLSDAFPGVRAERITFALRQLAFARKAKAFVRQNGARFDVIDALIGALPFSREELGFRGIIVARSVGLYRLYERFEQSVEQRWPQISRGKLAGRLFYRFARRRLLKASERAVRTADLINVPNEEEAACLRYEMGIDRVVVQPYGLTDDRRQSLAEGAHSAEIRLAQKRICFIGMWSARKGAYDWAQIIERVRQEIPDAQFRFLGTMLDAPQIQRDLGEAASKNIELISDYQPDQLPGLLNDCTAGAFPSYAEGFGLGVIEQLAAGLPTIAYDVAGPRHILEEQLREFLVPCGDVASFAASLFRILRLDPVAYRELSERSKTAATTFSWSEIARETIDTYERSLRNSARPIVFFQPFSLGWAGGGARILRALTAHAPLPWRSICSSPAKPKPWNNELHLRSRPSWGPLEHSRLAALPKATARFFARGFRRRLRHRCRQFSARAIHAVPHAGTDFAAAHAVARDLGLPFFLSLHDDLAYTAGAQSRAREKDMRAAWQGAAECFVISEALGKEYCRRYGGRSFAVVTDGLTSVGAIKSRTDEKILRIYFMGLFHMAYEQNLRALLDGLAIFQREHPGVTTSVTLRCEHVRPEVVAGFARVKVLPFADEAQVQRDLETADLLYMPIPFGPEHENFARYSLSTKMVTYVGSGVPVLYHGPPTSAAFDLLHSNDAAILLTTLEPNEIAATFERMNIARRAQVTSNALTLARRDFMLPDQIEKFWGAIERALEKI